MNRRQFMTSLLAGAAAVAVDPEQLLWVPGRKKIFIPNARPAVTVNVYVNDILQVRGRDYTLWSGLIVIQKPLGLKDTVRAVFESAGDVMSFKEPVHNAHPVTGSKIWVPRILVQPPPYLGQFSDSFTLKYLKAGVD